MSLSLEHRWEHLIAKLSSPGNATDCYQQLSQHYNGSTRYYHNWDHIKDSLDLLDRYPGVIEDPLAIEFAVWFHDVIYDTKKTDNEEQSAAWARDRMQELALDCALIEKVQDLIRATDHKQIYLTGDNALIQDIDLGTLGSKAERYLAYSHAIRREYQQYPDAIYKVGRKQVLESFLGRQKIYQTDYFHNLYEETARQNILTELNSIDVKNFQ